MRNIHGFPSVRVPPMRGLIFAWSLPAAALVGGSRRAVNRLGVAFLLLLIPLLSALVDARPVWAQNADVAIFKTAPPNVTPGDQIQYLLTATNAGPADATNVTLTDVFPAGLVFAGVNPSQGSGTLMGATLNFNFGTIAAGGTATLSINFVVPANTPIGTTLSNTANITATEPDPFTGNNTSTAVTVVGPPTTGTAASQLIDQMRQTFARVATQTTSQVTSDSVTSAITDAFNGGGSTRAANGRISTSFAAIENDALAPKKRDNADRASAVPEALAALGYDKSGPPIGKAPFPPRIAPSPWHVWIDARYTGLDDKRLSTFDARHVNVTGGISYRFTEYFLAGLVTGYEDFNYELGVSSAKLDGNGWNAGGYFGWKVWGQLRLDGMLTYGRINYGAQADAVTADFDADRITSMLRLSGRYGFAAGWYVEPSARLIYANEKQDAFVDTAGVQHSKFSFDVGLASFGGEVGAPIIWDSWIVTPSVGLYGDYRFGNDSVSAVATLPNFNDGWSARATGGLRWSAANGFSTSIGADYGGLGSDTRYWRARGSAGFKF